MKTASNLAFAATAVALFLAGVNIDATVKLKESSRMAASLEQRLEKASLHEKEMASAIIRLKEELKTAKRPKTKTVTQIVAADGLKKDTPAKRGCNPLNVKTPAQEKWRGQIGEDSLGHAIFSSLEYGIRAASITLKNYERKHGIKTVRGLVTRFAVPFNADYMDYLCSHLNLKPDETFSIIKRMPDLLYWMSRYESGERLPRRFFVGYDIVAMMQETK